MPTLTQEFAEITSASHERLALKLIEQVCEFQRQIATTNGTANGSANSSASLLRLVQDAARQATDRTLQELQLAETDWRSALNTLTHEPFGDAANVLLLTMLRAFQAGILFVQSIRSLWLITESLGAEVETRESLEHTEKRYRALAAEASKAIVHRSNERQPADPARLQEGLAASLGGQIVPAEEAKQWFRES